MEPRKGELEEEELLNDELAVAFATPLGANKGGMLMEPVEPRENEVE